MAIETIKAGDYVLSFDEGKKEKSYKKVTDTFVRTTELIYTVSFVNGEKLETTWNHPFWVLKKGVVRESGQVELGASLVAARFIDSDSLSGENNSRFDGEWISAKDLKAGDVSLTAGGKRLLIASITPSSQSETVYNFSVADNHTYFVGVDEVLVHNTDGCGGLSGFAQIFAAAQVAKADCNGSAACEARIMAHMNEQAEQVRMGQAVGDIAAAGVAVCYFMCGPASLTAGAWLGAKWNSVTSSIGNLFGRNQTPTKPDKLYHYTTESAYNSIKESNTFTGKRGIYATPVEGLTNTNPLKLNWYTGLTPSNATNVVEFPQAANSLFQRPIPVGPYSAWQYASRMYYTPPGSINMTTGQFTPANSLIGPRTFTYGVDALIYGGTGAAGYTVIKNKDKKQDE